MFTHLPLMDVAGSVGSCYQEEVTVVPQEPTLRWRWPGGAEGTPGSLGVTGSAVPAGAGSCPRHLGTWTTPCSHASVALAADVVLPWHGNRHA